MLASATEHYATQRRLTRRTVLAARRARFGSLDVLTALVTGAQALVARDAIASVPDMLAEQGIDTDTAAAPVATALAGTANDGRSLRSLLDFTRSEQVTPATFDLIVMAQLADTARQSASVAMAVTPKVTRYARLLVPPSCSRCAILAGRLYRTGVAFQRHPRCDCRHIPSSEALAGDLTTDPNAYFDSLDAAAQERAFTKAGAKAIRDGADIGRVVNARRGMGVAQGGLRATTEAATRRGINRKVRLMPESIYEIADDRADALRLLKAHGYIR